MKFLVVNLFVVLFAASSAQYHSIDVEDKEYWLSSASARLDQVLKRQMQNTVAKNVIIFVGDGMGITTVTAGRIYQGQKRHRDGESNVLAFEKFPVTGLSKTYNVDHQVPDSASTATAMFSGVKTRLYVLGLDSIASFNSCHAETNNKAKVSSFMTWAQDQGKDTGIVTTTRITHATPAATYSHTNNRDWECDGVIPKQDIGCVKDIARQLVEDAPGKNFKVILGGGRFQLGDNRETDSDGSCKRKDGRNLAMEWKNSKTKSRYVTTADELSRVDIKNTNYLLGLFAPGHIPYRAENVPTRPTLRKMTETAIRMLQKNSKGFALMVEGGRIDHGHHGNLPGLALSELVDMDEAVDAAVRMTDPSDTLIIVTADHSHAMTFNGYPDRGASILGLAQNDSQVFYQTLTYANGPGFQYHRAQGRVDNCKNCSEVYQQSANTWRDIRNDTSMDDDVFYRHLATLYLPDETHGGEDVPIYARGPMSHLLTGVHEQNYIATVISYAACIGPESKRCINGPNNMKLPPSASSASINTLFGALLSLTLAALVKNS